VLQLTPSQLEAILAHELAHVRRHDYLLNLIQTAVETLLFFHPAVWWMSRRIRAEREHAADDLALRATGDDRATYAGALAALEELRTSTPPAPALAARGGPLLARVRRVLGAPHPTDRATWWPAAGLAALALVGVILAGPRASNASQSTTQQNRTRTAAVVCVDDAGRPIAGAQVYIVDWFAGRHPIAVTPMGPVVTGADGVAKFDGLPAGDDLEGSTQAYAKVPGKLAGIGYNASNVIGARPYEQPVRVLMRPSPPLRGRLTVPDGVAAVSLAVRVESLSSKSHEGFAQFHVDLPGRKLWPEILDHRVGADGTFELRDIPDGAGISLYAHGPGVATTWLHRLPQPADGFVFRHTLEPEAVIEGVLVDQDGRAIAGDVEVRAVNDTPPLDNPNRTPIDVRPQQEGRFRISGLHQGVHTLSVLGLPDDRAAEPIQVRVERGQTVRDLKIALERGVVVTGTVIDAATGKPLSDAMVGVTPDRPSGGNAIARSAATGTDGRFTVRAPSAPVRLYVFKAPEGHGNGEAVALDLRPGQPAPPEVQFKLGPWKPHPAMVRAMAPKGGLRGRVIDEQNQPLSNLIVQCRVARPGGNFGTTTSARTRDDGRYEFGHLEVGIEHKVTVPEWRTTGAESDVIKVEAERTHDVPDLQVAPRPATAEVRGRIVNERDEPVTKAWVRINEIDWTGPDAEGRFRFEVYDASPQFTVFVQAASYHFRHARVEPGEEVKIVLEPMQPGEEPR
jgi:hypothetical protein